jgi:hypothetical protein
MLLFYQVKRIRNFSIESQFTFYNSVGSVPAIAVNGIHNVMSISKVRDKKSESAYT